MKRLEDIAFFDWRMFIASVVLLMSGPGPLSAEDEFAKERAALALIRETANDLCKDVPLSGKKNENELFGEAKGAVDWLIKKLVNIEVKIGGKYTTSEYEGVLREDLVPALRYSSNCKLSVLQELKDIVPLRQQHDIVQLANNPKELAKGCDWREAHDLVRNFVSQDVKYGPLAKTPLNMIRMLDPRVLGKHGVSIDRAPGYTILSSYLIEDFKIDSISGADNKVFTLHLINNTYRWYNVVRMKVVGYNGSCYISPMANPYGDHSGLFGITPYEEIERVRFE